MYEHDVDASSTDSALLLRADEVDHRQISLGSTSARPATEMYRGLNCRAGCGSFAKLSSCQGLAMRDASLRFSVKKSPIPGMLDPPPMMSTCSILRAPGTRSS